MTIELAPCDVAIVGGGPSGIAAALALRAHGFSVTIIEREAEIGGIPRHCAHSPFGMREFGRVLFGPSYARRLAIEAQKSGVKVLTRHSVTKLGLGGRIELTLPEGLASIGAKRVLLATGAREMPRSARFISGERPVGIITTGTLQQAVNLEKLRPMNKALIVGTELVSFSALLTCRTNGIKPVAMIDESPRVIARSPLAIYPKIMGIPLFLGVKIFKIFGSPRVEGVTLQKSDGSLRDVECDGIVLTGHFTGEGSLALCNHIELDPATGGPAVDQYGRTSDPTYFAAGNLLHPVETAGWCFREGRKIGHFIAADLMGQLPSGAETLKIVAGNGVRYVFPQRVVTGTQGGLKNFQLRVQRKISSGLTIVQDGNLLWSRKAKLLPERRILVPLNTVSGTNISTEVTFRAGED